MNKLAKEINELLLENVTIKEYLLLKKEIEEDEHLVDLYSKLDAYRKDICKNKEKDSDEYYKLLALYNSDPRVAKYKMLKKEIQEYFVEISDILTLK